MPSYNDPRGFFHRGESSDFVISDEFVDGTDNYFGFLRQDGGWVILKQDTVAKTYRFASGKRDYVSNMADCTNLTYDYYNEVFS